MRTLCCALGLLCFTQAARGQASSLGRPLDPLVLSGSALPGFLGSNPGDLVGFRYAVGGWYQIPVQVDERALLDVVTPYGNLGSGLGYGPSPTNPRVLFYTDATTLTGADPVAAFDADDELVFMVRDAGGRASGVPAPAGTVAGTGLEIVLVDPAGGQGYVYLFRHNGALNPGAGMRYVVATSNLATTPGFPVNATGTNAENTTIATARYSWHFSSEWVSDELKLFVGNNVDILDRHKNFFVNGNCVRHEDAFSANENAFVAVKAGPVRAIRSYMGAVSGPLTQRTHLFYEGRHDIATDLRVHSIPSIQDAFDYAPTASSMVYRNSLNFNGVVIDGRPDAVALGDVAWEQVAGPPGTLTVLHGRSTNLTAAEAAFTSYYDDNSTAPASNCTGDGQAWGTSGVSVQFLSSSVCTDPIVASGCGAASAGYRTLRTTRTLYMDPANGLPTGALTYQQQRNNPLQVSVGAFSTPTAVSQETDAGRVSVYPNPGLGRVTVTANQASELSVYNTLGQLLLVKEILAGETQVEPGRRGVLTFLFVSKTGRTVVRQVML